MIKNLIKITIRNFRRQLGFSLLNILGLTIGIAVSIIGFIYVFNELSYDTFHKNADRVHRISVDLITGGTAIKSTRTAGAYAEALYRDFPEIDKVSRIGAGEFKFEYEEKSFVESNVFAVDSTFFDIFTFPVIQGKTSNLLNEPYCAVITESTAQKYFGDINPINKVLREGNVNYKVIAVIKNVPENSHFHFDIAVSIISYDGYYNNPNWWAGNFRTYIMLHQNVDYKQLESKFPEFVDRNVYGGKYSDALADGRKWELFLQPLTSIHLNSNMRSEFEANGRKEYVIIILIISIFILIIACINYINLSTAKSARRSKEVGVRKVLGAERKHLIWQFLLESLFFSFISLIFAMMFVELSKPIFNQLSNQNLIIDYTKPVFFIGLIGIMFFTGLVGGSYPALVLSSFNPITALKGGISKIGKSNRFRNVLVIIQFVISAVLIIGTFIISDQLNLMQNKNLGFDKENVITIRNASVIRNSMQAIKKDISSLAFVQGVSHSNRLPGVSFTSWGCIAEGREGHFMFSVAFSDETFDDVLKLELVKGRYFSKEYGTDTMAVIINEEAEKLIGFDEIIGKRISFRGSPPIYVHIIGVVKNIHFESKHQKVHPMAILNISNNSNAGSYLSVRLKQTNIEYAIKELSGVWGKYSPDEPMDYAFFDEQYDTLYRSEMLTKKLFLVFSFLAIFIACLGLLGLTFYILQQKTKEIGIRKTFGASPASITYLLSKEFSKWVIIANIIAWPIAWYFFDNWLNKFIERCQLSWMYFALATIISFLIALVTISYQTIKTSKEKPIDALKYE